MGWLIAAIILVLLAILPLGVSAVYDAGGAVVRLIAGTVRIKLYPAKPKKEKKKNPKMKAAVVSGKKAVQEPEKQTGGSFRDFLPLLSTLLEFLGKFRRKLRVNRLDMKLIMAADDPCDLAVNYGRAWAAVGNLMPQLERFLIIKRRNVEVECDFTSEQTVIYARLDLTITLGRLLSLATVYGIRVLRQYLTIMKTRKGGVNS